MAAQVFYPDHYNGAFIACPDPVDFHAYTNIDLYSDANAYFLTGAILSWAVPLGLLVAITVWWVVVLRRRSSDDT